MNRRNFLKSTAAIGTLATLNLNLNASAVTGGTEKKVASVCEMCSSRCPIEVTVKDGRGALIEGNHRFANKTSVCARGGAGINQLYDDQRLIKPLIRVGERGEGKFKEASWDEALKICAQRLDEISPVHTAARTSTRTGPVARSLTISPCHTLSAPICKETTATQNTS